MHVLNRALGLAGAAAAAVVLTVAPSWAGVIEGDGEAEALTGTDTTDFIYGRGGDDTIIGLDGSDALYGDGNSDTLEGGAGWDFMEGGTGPDELVGGPDGDTLWPMDGSDTVRGGSSGDAIYVAKDGSVDHIRCGEGDDEVHYGFGVQDPLDTYSGCEHVGH